MPPYDHELAKLPLYFGVREAAAFLQINHSGLRRKAYNSGSMYTCDCALMRGGELSPLWSLKRLQEIKKARETRPQTTEMNADAQRQRSRLEE